MEVTVQYLGGVRFEAATRGHRVMCDQPLESGGTDQGMAPPEFLLTSLATCAGYYAAQYLNARHLSTEGLRVRVNAEKAAQPPRLGSFLIDVEAPGVAVPEAERHQAGLFRAVQKCLIHNTLLHPPEIQIAVHVPPTTGRIPAAA